MGATCGRRSSLVMVPAKISGDAHPSASDDSVLNRASQASLAGSELFAKRQYAKAIAAFTEAIDEAEEDTAAGGHATQGPGLHVHYANRSLCHMEMRNYTLALGDATRAVELKPDFRKGWYRRGASHLSLGHIAEAEKDFAHLCGIAPNDSNARAKLVYCRKQLEKHALKAAIAECKAQLASDAPKATEPVLLGSPTREPWQPTPKFSRELMAWQRSRKTISADCARQIVLEVIALLEQESTMVDVEIPEAGSITIVGDLHGQYDDLLQIWELNGLPSEQNPYLFNGDFVDRGPHSLEVVLSLFAWKLVYPKSVLLARGNHETRSMSSMYGFKQQVVEKYGESMYETFCDAFDLLPLCHVLDREVFVVHGGLFAEDGITLDDIRSMDRRREPLGDDWLAQLLWSDPQDGLGRKPSKRGFGVEFGEDVTAEFLRTNGLRLIIRSHELKEDGYDVQHGGTLITIFSAPNYCGRMGNKGAFLRLDAGSLTPKITVFDAACPGGSTAPLPS